MITLGICLYIAFGLMYGLYLWWASNEDLTLDALILIAVFALFWPAFAALMLAEICPSKVTLLRRNKVSDGGE